MAYSRDSSEIALNYPESIKRLLITTNRLLRDIESLLRDFLGFKG